MIRSRFVCRLMFVLCSFAIATCVFAQGQQGSSEYKPVERQDGKDVVWLPTAQALVDKMLDMAKVTPQDYVVDLGSGDGRTVITAAKRGARALGIEYNPNMVALAKRNAEKEGVGDKARFMQGDLFQTDFSQATVLTLFLLPEINYQLRPKILNMKPGTRIVSNTFDMSEWIADQTATIDDSSKCSEYCSALLWIVPAKVAGAWKLPQAELVLEQSFQTFSGRLNSGAEMLTIKNGRLNGDQISFTAGTVQYIGRVNGNSMQGTLKSGDRTAEWSAIRISKAASR
ncbi:MAG TPA: class I SAM-dependent methyltransferase [Syntrophorhabdales bacterium]|nr:class I SAM-dependent methyltransferase [Syntrophorhabdales bacterium]